MKDWIETLMPLIVAIVPVIITVVKTARDTRKASKAGMEELGKKLQDHIEASEKQDMKVRRVRILRFADDISKGSHFTKEYWTDILEDMSEYSLYCDRHKEDFRNEKCTAAMSYIRDEYAAALRTNDFAGV